MEWGKPSGLPVHPPAVGGGNGLQAMLIFSKMPSAPISLA